MSSVDDLLDHLEGNAPKNTPPPPVSSIRMDMKTPKLWYHGKLSRSQTEKLLLGRPSGSFLVRDSTSSAGDFVLSVCEHGRISHYIVAFKQNGYKIGDRQFQDLPSVIDYYKKQMLDTTTLTIPVDFENPDASTGRGAGAFLAVVRAMFDFPGSDSEDLPFSRNEVLHVLKKNDDNWWFAQNSQGKTGAIPCTYVQVMHSYSPSIAPSAPESQRPGGPNLSQKARLERSQSMAVTGFNATDLAAAAAEEANRANRPLRSTSDAPMPGSDVSPARSQLLANQRRGSNATASPGSVSSGEQIIKKIVKVYDSTGLFKAITVSPSLFVAKDVKEAAMSKFALLDGKWCLYEVIGNTERLLDDSVSILDLAQSWGTQEYKLLLKAAKDSRPAPAAPSKQETGPAKFRSSDPRVIAQAIAVMNRVPNAYDTTALAFNIGDIIDVTQMNETGLWYGIVNGKYGHFPMTAANLVDDSNPNGEPGSGSLALSSSNDNMLSDLDSVMDQLKNI